MSAGKTGKSPSADQRILRSRGDPKTLLTFQKAEVVYDITFRFAHRYLARGDRTIDQMIQSARSGKKIAELLDDYEDFLRVREKAQWDRESKEALYVRRLGRKTPQTYEPYREFVETRPPEVVANIAICLIHQTDYLLDRQLQRLEEDFLKEGGLRERMTQARLAQRKQSSQR